MIKINYDNINETIYHEVLENGLNVFCLPKKGFQKTYVTFSTNFGSLNTDMYQDKEKTSLPEGIAHFLEHKLFEQDGTDVSSVFASNQGDVNAYTQHNRTTYLFNCTDHFYENLHTLLDFVQHPKFTKEGIDKEQGIINQEIKMYEDDPGSIAYYGIIRNLFKDHPITLDILGTKESLLQINKDLLTTVHDYYYNPNNMILFIAGNIIPEEVLEYVKRYPFTKPSKKVKYTHHTYDDVTVHHPFKEVTSEIVIPNHLLGIKLLPTDPSKEQFMKKELSLSLLIDLTIGKSSNHFKNLLEKGLINDSFSTDITLDHSFGYFLVGGETKNPVLFDQELRKIFLNLDSYDISQEDFKKAKKQLVGSFIKSLNSLEFIASVFTKYYYYNCSLFNILEVSKSITLDDLNSYKKLFSDEKAYASFTINPKK